MSFDTPNASVELNAQHVPPSPLPVDLGGSTVISTLRDGDRVRVTWGPNSKHDGTVVSTFTKMKGTDTKPITVHLAQVQHDDGACTWVDDEFGRGCHAWVVERLASADAESESAAESAKRPREKPQTFATYNVEDGPPAKPRQRTKSSWEVERVLE